MKKLPKVFQNEYNKNIHNNKKECYIKDISSDRINKEETKVLEQKEETDLNFKEDITNTLDKIFSGMGYSYNIPLIIETKNKTYKTSLIAKTSNNVITLDNDIIPISNIINIIVENNTKN